MSSVIQAEAESPPQDRSRGFGAELSVIVPTYNESGNIAEMVRRLDAALYGIRWEVIFVDDNSPDRTIDVVHEIAARDNRVRGIHRIGRRGLAGATIEGMMASGAPYTAVIDGDLQHDETKLRDMLDLLRSGTFDIVIGTRARDADDRVTAMGKTRARGSLLANGLANFVLKAQVGDPMSGFFMLKRALIERYASQLSVNGFKILFDILATARGELRIGEVDFEFRARHSGESKLDRLVVLDYLSLLFSRLVGGRVPPRFLLFLLVGASGLVVNMATVFLFRDLIGFDAAQALALVTSIISNYLLNNSLTYRNSRHRGWKMLTGLISFTIACSIGAVVNYGVALFAHHHGAGDMLSVISGAVVAALWNYISSSTVTWRSA